MLVPCVEVPAKGVQAYSENQVADCDKCSCKELAYRRGTETRREVVSVKRRTKPMFTIFPEQTGDEKCVKAWDFGYMRGRKNARGVKQKRLPISKMYGTKERMAYYRGYECGYDKGKRFGRLKQ